MKSFSYVIALSCTFCACGNQGEKQEGDPSTQGKLHSDSDSDSDADSDNDGDSDADSDSDGDSDVDSDSDGNSDADSDSDGDFGSESDSDADDVEAEGTSHEDGDGDTERDTDRDTEEDTETASHRNTDTNPGTEEEADTAVDSVVTVESDILVDTDVSLGTDSAEVRSAGCGKIAERRDAQTQQTMRVNATTRYYLVYMPESYDPNTPLPLVMALHGANMNNWWAANDTSGFNLIPASNEQAILVYPQGTGDPPGTTSHWGTISATWDPTPNSSDMQFIDALLSSMQESYCIDTKRMFVTGFSAGAWTTMNLACHHADVFRAFAPVAGWGPGDMSTGHGSAPNCADTNVAVPILITQGTTDDIVVPAVCGEASRDFWIERNECDTAASPTSTSGCVANEGCRDGLAVVYCTHGGDHMVPGNAGVYMWEFFNSFR